MGLLNYKPSPCFSLLIWLIVHIVFFVLVLFIVLVLLEDFVFWRILSFWFLDFAGRPSPCL